MSSVTLGRYASTWVPCERDPDRDLRAAAYVLGIAGTGKSTLLANLAEQCAAAGEGVLVVDIKGELAEDIVSRTKLPPERVVYVAPGECDFPDGRRYWTLNPLEFDRSRPALESMAVGNLLSLFERMGMAKLDRMVQVRQLLQMTTRLALMLPEPTLPDLMRLLYEPTLRARLVQDPRLSDAVRRFWDRFEEMTPRERRDKADSTFPRLNEFLSDVVVDHLVSSPRSTVRLAEWLDAGKLVVMNLGKNVALEVNTLLGNFVVASLVNAAYAHPTVNQGGGRIWRVLIDEFQELAGPQFSELIAQARKYQVFPILAHQNLAQLSDELTNAVLSCPIRFFLSTSAEDRTVIRRLFGEETADGLDRLPRFQARVHLRDGAEGRFRQETLRLADWWAERDDRQLTAAIAAADDDRFTVRDRACSRMDQRTDTVQADPHHPFAAAVPPAAPPPAANQGARRDQPRVPRRILDALPQPDGEEAAGGAVHLRPEPGAPLPAQAHPAGDRHPRRVRPARILDQLPDL